MKVLCGSVARWLSQNRRWLLLIFATDVSGLATPIRIGGFFAGVLVSALFVGKLRAEAAPALALYWIVGPTVTYIGWPYLWRSPVDRLLETARVVRCFDHVSQELSSAGSKAHLTCLDSLSPPCSGSSLPNQSSFYR